MPKIENFHKITVGIGTLFIGLASLITVLYGVFNGFNVVKVTFDKETDALITKIFEHKRREYKRSDNPSKDVENLQTSHHGLETGDIYISPKGKRKLIKDLRENKEAVLMEKDDWFRKYDMKIKGYNIKSGNGKTRIVID